jgi:WD40 repeat protein
VFQVELSPDGALLASAGDDRTARVWDLAGGAPPLVLRHETGVQGVGFSPDGRTLGVTGRDGSLSLWDPRAGRRFEVLRADTVDLAWVHLGERWAVTTDGHVIRAWRYDRAAAERPRGAAWLAGLVVRRL